MLPCLIFEDDHLLVVNKPAGLNTHSPSPFAGEGIYDWLRHREPRWSKLAIIHRLDKETSGLLLFSKTAVANRSLTQQFAARTVRKKYLVVSDKPMPADELVVRSALVRAGEKYISRSATLAQIAETRFRALKSPVQNLSIAAGSYWIEAEPLTGRTHQIRVHAADKGFPILGDRLYGGTSAPRVFLHATELSLRHPETNQSITFHTPPDFDADPRVALRKALIDPQDTNIWRIYHGASDGWPGWYVDRLGDYLLWQSEDSLSTARVDELTRLLALTGAAGASHRVLSRQVGQKGAKEASPRSELGQAAPERFWVRENGLRFELSFSEGYSVGLFLDQRDNRRRLLTGHIAEDFSLFGTQGGKPSTVLNTFAYTCGFSVCAAKAGAHTTSLDLSKKYLDWGKRNFEANGINAADHDFIFGDVFDWLRRLARKERLYDVILIDPPTFSQSKASGPFRAEKDYGRLIDLALPLLKPSGVLFASTNAADWLPEKFISAIEKAIHSVRRKILQRHYVPQPPDFPISRSEPAYLKTVWLRID